MAERPKVGRAHGWGASALLTTLVWPTSWRAKCWVLEFMMLLVILVCTARKAAVVIACDLDPTGAAPPNVLSKQYNSFKVTLCDGNRAPLARKVERHGVASDYQRRQTAKLDPRKCPHAPAVCF
jgi:hypothetical protein